MSREALARAREVVQRLRGLYGPLRPPGDTSDPFRVLIRTILSQNTSYKNELKAYRALEARVGITPEALARADLSVIEECVRPAGQHRQRARRLKEIARLVLERYGGDLWPLLTEEPVEEAKEELMSLPGVGRKTADILLLFCARRHVFPVDRHIMRITARLGLVKPPASYEAVRSLFEQALDTPEELLFAHLAIIRLGREICQARRPRCQACPLADICPTGASI